MVAEAKTWLSQPHKVSDETLKSLLGNMRLITTPPTPPPCDFDPQRPAECCQADDRERDFCCKTPCNRAPDDLYLNFWLPRCFEEWDMYPEREGDLLMLMRWDISFSRPNRFNKENPACPRRFLCEPFMLETPYVNHSFPRNAWAMQGPNGFPPPKLMTADVKATAKDWKSSANLKPKDITWEDTMRAVAAGMGVLARDSVGSQVPLPMPIRIAPAHKALVLAFLKKTWCPRPQSHLMRRPGVLG